MADFENLKAQITEVQKTLDELAPLKGFVDEVTECMRQQTIDYEAQSAEWSEYKEETAGTIEALRDEVAEINGGAEIKTLRGQMGEAQKTLDEILPLKGFVDEFSECIRQQSIDYESQAAEWSEFKEETTGSIEELQQALEELGAGKGGGSVERRGSDDSSGRRGSLQKKKADELESKLDQLVDEMSSLRREHEERDAEHNKLSSLVQSLLDTFEEFKQDSSKPASAPETSDSKGMTDTINAVSASLEACKEDCARFQKERNELQGKVDALENDVMKKAQFEVLRQDLTANASKVLSAEQEIKNLALQLKAHRQENIGAVDRPDPNAGSVKQSELQTQLAQMNSSLSAQQSQMKAQLLTQLQSDLQAQVKQLEQRLSQSVSVPVTPAPLLPPLESQRSPEGSEVLQTRTGELERRVTNIFEQVNTILQQDFVTKKDFEEVVQQTWDAINSSTLTKDGGAVANELKEEIDKNHRGVWEAVLQLQMKQHTDSKRKETPILPQGNPGTPLRSGSETPTRVVQPTVVRSSSATYLPVGTELNGNGAQSPTPLSPRVVQPQQVIVQPTMVTGGGAPRMQTTPVTSRSSTPQRLVSPGPGLYREKTWPPSVAQQVIATPNGTQVKVLSAPRAGSFPNSQAS